MRPSSPHDTVSQMKYLMPLDFYEEIFKDILIKKGLKPGQLLGLDVNDNYVSLAVSDWKNKTAVPLRALDRQENNLSSMLAENFQSLISLTNLWTDAQTQIFIDDLYKTGKFEGLKYTLWHCAITSKNAKFVFNQNLKFILENLPQLQLEPQPQPQPQLELEPQPQPQDIVKTIVEKCYAVHAQQPQPQPQPYTQDIAKTIMEKCYAVHALQSIQPQPQSQDIAKTIMEKCYAVRALQGYLDITNKMAEEDWDWD
ncbi:hypothetical protein Dsin_014213 [Dipteronia sinensis]|uniref:Uncharacterized protein n=1 Tax=Dipteronia sinensis TaxID=43782 RepID=A0AAE0ALH8_9ROSI|nr:hypothetical protein Dsin_014213 [Dipteronia sinensis]